MPDPDPSQVLRFRYSNNIGRRLDHYLSETRGDTSRARWQNLIRDGAVLVNGKPTKPNQNLRLGDEIVCTIPAPVELTAQPEERRNFSNAAGSMKNRAWAYCCAPIWSPNDPFAAE